MAESTIELVQDLLTTTTMTFNEICRKHGIAKVTVNNLFKARYGLTAIQWREKHCNSTPALDAETEVLTKVAKDLVKGNDTVKQLAYRYDFTDAHTLMLKFKAQYGLSPTHYRKQHQP